jgi:hypothetical protein
MQRVYLAVAFLGITGLGFGLLLAINKLIGGSSDYTG